MGTWPVKEKSTLVTNLGGGVQVTPGSANVKGNWAQMTSGLSYPIQSIVYGQDYMQTSTCYLVDIGVGSAGNEVIILDNLLVCPGSGSNSFPSSEFYLPVSIPASTRIAVRAQCAAGASAMYTNLHCYSQSFLSETYMKPVTYGAATATSRGTSVDPGSSAYTMGAYTELTSSTTRSHKMVIFGIGTGIATRADAVWWIQLAVGSAGSETVIAEVMSSTGTTGHQQLNNFSFPYDLSIPAGSRLAVRCQSGQTNATYRKIDVVLYCF